MPTGKVKFFDADRGFGFISGEDGSQVFVHASALPADVPALKPGARVEYGVADGRKGPQALTVTLLDPPPTAVKVRRKSADDMTVLVEDLITLLDGVGETFRRGRYPERAAATKVATVLRAVADDLDA